MLPWRKQDKSPPEERAAMELIFKVANATVGAVVYEAAKGGSPPAAPPLPSTPQRSQKQRLSGQRGRTPQTQTPLTRASTTDCADDASPQTHGTQDGEEDDDEDLDGLGVLDLSLEELDDDEVLQSPPLASPKGRGRGPPRGGSKGGGKGGASSREFGPTPPPPGSLKALPADQVQRFLELVQRGDCAEALKALRRVRRAVKGRGCSKEAFGGTRALLHHLLEAYAQAGRLPEALDLLGDMKGGAEARLVSAAAFNAVLRGLLTRGSLDEARWIVREEMPRLGVAPNESSLNLLMDTMARAGPAHLEEAWDVLEDMQRRGLRADKYTVSILTKGISERVDKRRVPRSVALVEHFLKSQPDDVDEVLVNSLLDVFCRMNDMNRLEATLTKMREYGIRGSAVTYGTIVKAYGRAGNIEKVVQAWDAMSKEGLEANAVTYGCMLDACVKCGHLDRAFQVFGRMKEQGIHKNTILYATLIKGLAKSKDPSAARKLHQEMVAEGVNCNVVVFNSLIDACVRASDLNGAAEVLQEMTSAGVRPDLITFSTLIKGYCNSGELHKAMRLSEELQARNLQCDEIVYNSLLEGCVKAGDLQLGLRLFSEMRGRNVLPSPVTFSIMVKLLSRAGRLDLACHLVAHEMRELHGVAPTRMVWSCLVTCCVKARDVARAVVVLDLLDREAGAAAGARTSLYATVVEGCLAQGEVGAALSLCERAFLRAHPEERARGASSLPTSCGAPSRPRAGAQRPRPGPRSRSWGPGSASRCAPRWRRRSAGAPSVAAPRAAREALGAVGPAARSGTRAGCIPLPAAPSPARSAPCPGPRPPGGPAARARSSGAAPVTLRGVSRRRPAAASSGPGARGTLP
ncbi:unnamed protein product [Prorocentrum cordatum]|uniref:PROP1-like PPR domain-containing protein n=1 Tax=Prorocentrum cordatum TaxID=2364126 RepID=A0ABN9QG16_9DINO|nr:unnamed protein product [Polarella glacialis]